MKCNVLHCIVLYCIVLYCMYGRMDEWMDGCMHACMHLCMIQIHLFIYIYIHIYIYTYIYIYRFHLFLLKSPCLLVFIFQQPQQHPSDIFHDKPSLPWNHQFVWLVTSPSHNSLQGFPGENLQESHVFSSYIPIFLNIGETPYIKSSRISYGYMKIP